MNEYILLMHTDAVDQALAEDGDRWTHYLTALRHSNQFHGGSSIGSGQCFRQLPSPHQPALPSLTSINGFIRVRAESLTAARQFLIGNPIYEAGGTVEIRELLKD